ncbi:MAG: ParA family protein [Erysipelotrichia bacterium]|nr:ParA family protein [Erysipelotrichia bacterium]
MENVISVFNYKGGVGKTTIALNLAKHLNYQLHEVKRDYLYEIFQNNNESDTQDNLYAPLPYENGKMCFKQHCIVDINCIDNTLSAIIEASTKVIVPTMLDMKDIIKTLASIEYIKKKNKKCSIVLVINNLSNKEKETDVKYTKRLIHEINSYMKSPSEQFQTLDTRVEDGYQYMTAIPKYSILYMRHNKIYFEFSHYQQFYLDALLKDHYKTMMDSYNDFSSYFQDNNSILEALFQYHFYYGALYGVHNENIQKEVRKFESNNPKPDEKASKKEKKIYNTLLAAHIKPYQTQYQLGGKKISTITSNFVKTNFPMLSEDNDFFNAMKAIINSKNDLKKWHKINIDDLEAEEPRGGELFMQKERFLYDGMQQVFKLKESNDHARTLKDFRILLCLLGVYNA